jgi:hypothetical protein
MREQKEDIACIFWGFAKHYLKNADVEKLELKTNEYFILKNKKIFGIK